MREANEQTEQTKRGKRGRMSAGQQSYLTLLLLLLAIVGITAATAAWFMISDRTRVYSLSMNITAGPSLRFDVAPHATFDEYLPTLSLERIADSVRAQQGYDMRTTPLNPVTTSDGVTFTFRDGTVVNPRSGAYWEIPLHFMASGDMIVHLTARNSAGKEDGTRISSKTPNLPESMRIAFRADGNVSVYDPGMGDSSTNFGKIRNFGLQSATQTVYNQNSVLFPLKAETDKTVYLCVWMEGTDEACTNELKSSDFEIRLRFEGTDEEGNVLSGKRREP